MSLTQKFRWADYIESALDGSNDRIKLLLYCQKISSLLDEELQQYRFAEVLLRLEVDGLVVAAGQFIQEIAGNEELMRRVDRWVFLKTIELAKKGDCCDSGTCDRYAINISVGSLSDLDFVQFIIESVAASGLHPYLFHLEVTEHQIFDLDACRAAVLLLQHAGLRVGLDDFGTSYSSLACLQKLPVSFIKLDGSFVRSVLIDRKTETIIRCIFLLATNLDLDLIAEFVETIEIANKLREIREEVAVSLKLYGQGYGLPDGKPRECEKY